MELPPEFEAFWSELQANRETLLKEVEGLSQTQFDWRPGESEWSIGEVIHHVTLAEVNIGKLTTKLLREAEAAGTLRPRQKSETPFEAFKTPGPGPFPASPLIWPEHGRPREALLAEIQAARERSRQSFERVAAIDPRPLIWKHDFLGDIHLGQYWTIIRVHDPQHLEQIQKIKAAQGFPRA
ncbi:MAG TPA: DinB family protein [Methylomirabilota bacterium]|nr:DinB family protein [Methylomirabilota bacterium]